MRQIIYLTPVFFALLFSSKVFALESQQDENYYLNACNNFLENSSDAAALPCSDYIHGFLAGARIVDSLFIDHLEDEHNRPLSFSERAYRTRVGKPQNDLLSLPSAPFCLPDSEFNSDIIDRLLGHMPESVASLEVMDQKIYNGLTLEYPCQ